MEGWLRIFSLHFLLYVLPLNPWNVFHYFPKRFFIFWKIDLLVKFLVIWKYFENRSPRSILKEFSKYSVALSTFKNLYCKIIFDLPVTPWLSRIIVEAKIVELVILSIFIQTKFSSYFLSASECLTVCQKNREHCVETVDLTVRWRYIVELTLSL